MNHAGRRPLVIDDGAPFDDPIDLELRFERFHLVVHEQPASRSSLPVRPR